MYSFSSWLDLLKSSITSSVQMHICQTKTGVKRAKLFFECKCTVQYSTRSEQTKGRKEFFLWGNDAGSLVPIFIASRSYPLLAILFPIPAASTVYAPPLTFYNHRGLRNVSLVEIANST